VPAELNHQKQQKNGKESFKKTEKQEIIFTKTE